MPAASLFKTPNDIVAAAKAKPGHLSYGSGGVGASAHLAGELFKSVAKVHITHIPYKGSGPALTDVMGGQLDFMFDTGAFPHIKGGKVRALAVAAGRRHPLLPGVPTFEELGVKGMVMNAWYGVAAPAGTPPAVVAKVNAAVNNALKSADFANRLADIGAEVRGGSPEEFSKFWRSEVVRYAGIVKLNRRDAGLMTDRRKLRPFRLQGADRSRNMACSESPHWANLDAKRRLWRLRAGFASAQNA